MKLTIKFFFYLTKAYNVTRKYAVWKKVYKSALCRHLLNFIKLFLADRKIRVWAAKENVNETKVDQVVTQGRVLW